MKVTLVYSIAVINPYLALQKRRSLLILIFFAINLTVSAQQHILNSNSTTVEFKAGDSFKITWHLRPEAKPDIYILPFYKEKQKLTFSALKDSITINARPGRKYDFIILVNTKDSCFIQIQTLARPIFLKKNISFPVLFGIFLIFIIGFINRNKIKIIPFLYFGIIAPAFFWVLTLTAGLIHGHYNHFTMVFSDLGAIGTKSELLMAVAELVLTIFSLLFYIGFYKACKFLGISTLPAHLSLSFPLSICWIAVFPLQHELHGGLGPIPALLNVGALLAFFLWKGKEFQLLRVISLVCFFIMSLIFLRLIPDFQNNYPGLIQRFYYFGWSIWFIALSLSFMKLIRLDKKNAPQTVQ
jgi:Protein of unknown function (DUF998)